METSFSSENWYIRVLLTECAIKPKITRTLLVSSDSVGVTLYFILHTGSWGAMLATDLFIRTTIHGKRLPSFKRVIQKYVIEQSNCFYTQLMVEITLCIITKLIWRSSALSVSFYRWHSSSSDGCRVLSKNKEELLLVFFKSFCVQNANTWRFRFPHLLPEMARCWKCRLPVFRIFFQTIDRVYYWWWYKYITLPSITPWWDLVWDYVRGWYVVVVFSFLY